VIRPYSRVLLYLRTNFTCMSVVADQSLSLTCSFSRPVYVELTESQTDMRATNKQTDQQQNIVANLKLWEQ